MIGPRQVGGKSHQNSTAGKIRVELRGTAVWGADEDLVLKSQLLFLEGELCFVTGDFLRARERFEESRAIDFSQGDRDGVEKNDRRLSDLRSIEGDGPSGSSQTRV